jgi:hypothetical protein
MSKIEPPRLDCPSLRASKPSRPSVAAAITIRMPAVRNCLCHRSKAMITAMTTRTAVIALGTLRYSFNSGFGALVDGFDFILSSERAE